MVVLARHTCREIGLCTVSWFRHRIRSWQYVSTQLLLNRSGQIVNYYLIACTKLCPRCSSSQLPVAWLRGGTVSIFTTIFRSLSTRSHSAELIEMCVCLSPFKFNQDLPINCVKATDHGSDIRRRTKPGLTIRPASTSMTLRWVIEMPTNSCSVNPNFLLPITTSAGGLVIQINSVH